MRESDIVYQSDNGVAFVIKEPGQYTVLKHSASGTHSLVDSAYKRNADGLSIAKARCNWIANRQTKGNGK